MRPPECRCPCLPTTRCTRQMTEAYRIYGLPAGRYTISVGDDPNNTSFGMRRSGFFQRTYHPDVLDPTKATVVEVGEGTEARDVDIKLGRRAPTYTATGRVVDAESGQPVTGGELVWELCELVTTGTTLGEWWAVVRQTRAVNSGWWAGARPLRHLPRRFFRGQGAGFTAIRYHVRSC